MLCQCTVTLCRYLAGDIMIGSRSHITARIDLLKGTQIRFTGTMVENPPLTFGDLIDTVVGSNAWNSQLPASLDNDIRNLWAFKALSVSFCTQPVSLTASGSMSLFGFVDLRAFVSIGELATKLPSGASYSYALAVQMDASATVSAILPSVRALDTFKFFKMSVAIAIFLVPSILSQSQTTREFR